MPNPPQYIEPQEVADIIRSKELIPGKDYLIVDVRGDDFGFGNIPGAINIPSHEFLDHPTEFLDKLAPIPKVIFHCALSQVRGPRCAMAYEQVRAIQKGQEEAQSSAHSGGPQEVLVLRGGFQNWQTQYGSDITLTEKLDAQFWKDYQ
ncbi:Rhodanese-like domain-containing protein [Phlyctochytrium arcticum]|nr:Rhodanese-like domain-containing protein [Phlyctochytrium arcticum]